MPESKKERILARYYILVNCGIKVSEEFRRLVESIQNERAAKVVAKVVA